MLLKQRNMIVRPDNAEKCELEMKKLEYFGWVRVCEKSSEDGSTLISFVRDEDECADKIESERKYRLAKVASDYASAAAERLSGKEEAKPAKMSIIGLIFAILFGILALACIALAIMPFMLQVSFYDNLFSGESMAQLGGEWTFFGFTIFNFKNSGFQVIALLLTCAFIAVAVFFAALGAFVFIRSFSKRLNKRVSETAISDKIAYLEEVKAAADADIAELYPTGEEAV